MANFFLDNEDIQFLFQPHRPGGAGPACRKTTSHVGNGRAGDYGPRDAADAVDNYRRVLEIIGEVAGDMLAPNAEDSRPRRQHAQRRRHGDAASAGAARTSDRLTQADLMGFTLPRKYGGLNCPNLVYTMANEIVSRADASLMNLFGLQGIAETIYAFANDEIKDEFLPRFASGQVTGAMVLTEPDAGSDLQAVRLRAYQDENGDWYLNGVKRFITNGCGEILLVLARSEPEISDGRGLSLFLSERSSEGPRAAPGEQAGHPRLAHLRVGLRRHARPG